MKIYTQEQIDQALEAIEHMDHYTMCSKWRFSRGDEDAIYFRSDLPTGTAFSKRLFDHFGGFTPDISKSLGFKP